MSDWNINNMDFKQLRTEVQLLRDELAIMKRKYEDILYNLDDDNFSSRFVKEKGDMRTAIEQNEKEIKLSASELGKEISSLSVTTKGIRSQVNNVENGEFNGYTLFEQTGSKFSFTGNVEISGNAIVGGIISGSELSNATGTHRLAMSTSAGYVGEYGTFRLYNDHYGDVPYFSVYDNTFGYVGLYAAGETFLGVQNSGGITAYPQGTWDFTSCDVEGLGGGYATFG